jgi:hypothetical protein
MNYIPWPIQIAILRSSIPAPVEQQRNKWQKAAQRQMLACDGGGSTKGSLIRDKIVPETRMVVIGTGPMHRGLLPHGGYCHACLLPTDHNLRSDARSAGEPWLSRAKTRAEGSDEGHVNARGSREMTSFGQRLANEAQRAREMALALPPGKKRDAFLEKARLADLGARINGWLPAPEQVPVKVVNAIAPAYGLIISTVGTYDDYRQGR